MENQEIVPVPEHIIGNPDNLTIVDFKVNPASIADQTNPKLESVLLGNDTTFEYKDGNVVYFNQWKTNPVQNQEQTLEWLKDRFVTEGLYFFRR